MEFDTYVNNHYGLFDSAERKGISIFDAVMTQNNQKYDLFFTNEQITVFEQMFQKENKKELFEFLINQIYKATYHSLFWKAEKDFKIEIDDWRNKLHNLFSDNYDSEEYFIEEYVEMTYPDKFNSFIESNPKPVLRLVTR